MAAHNITHSQCFVKGVVEGVEEGALRITLEKFGPIKEMEIVRNKACAFVEFEKLEAAQNAITASLHQSQGRRGGLTVATKGGSYQVTVETKKERGERQINRSRGGGHGQGVNGSGDGGRGYRGRGGPPRGRGGFKP